MRASLNLRLESCRSERKKEEGIGEEEERESFMALFVYSSCKTLKLEWRKKVSACLNRRGGLKRLDEKRVDINPIQVYRLTRVYTVIIRVARVSCN